ncbi:hypothetical protein [Photobacterium satsumensis]|uniref:hypothetical protein n=1 Tax=Photobacterium satsumensis TaxID=2910239 RepID=UPI003D0CFDC2
MKKVIYMLILYLSVENYAIASQKCDFLQWGDYNGSNLFRSSDRVTYAFKSSHVRLDADGAPNAYHPDDVGLHCTRGVGFKGLDCPANAGYPNEDWWSSVLVPSPKNPKEAFVQPRGPFEGYFVSKTSLINTNISDKKNPSRYVDATTIPYIVFPRNFYKRSGTGLMGDLGYSMNLRTGDKSAFVVADVGPSNAQLGEMSIYLAEKLGGSSPNPRTGTGSPKGEILYVVFPYSSKQHKWPLSNAEIEFLAESMLIKVGGIEAVQGCK